MERCLASIHIFLSPYNSPTQRVFARKAARWVAGLCGHLEKIMELSIDPEFHACLPASTPEELAQLEKNLLSEGLRDPLLATSEGLIVDGMTRYEICRRYGLPVKHVVKDFPTRNHAMAWIIDNQTGRRNLSSSQRAMLAAKRITLKVPIYLKRKSSQPVANSTVVDENPQKPQNCGNETQVDVAQAFKVSTRNVENAVAVLKHGTQSLQDQVVNGEVSVDTAAAVATQAPVTQESLVRRGPIAMRKAAAKIKAKAPTEDPDSPLPDSELVDRALKSLARFKGDLVALVGHEDASTEGDICGFFMRPQRQEWLKLIDALRHDLRVYRPYSVCPYCEGTRNPKHKCEVCKDIGWVGKISHHSCPPEYLDRIKHTIRKGNP